MSTGPDPRRESDADALLADTERRLEAIEQRCAGAREALHEIEHETSDERLTESASRMLTAVAFLTAAATAIFNTMKAAGRGELGKIWAVWSFFAYFVFAMSGLVFLIGAIWPRAGGKHPKNIPTLVRWAGGAVVCSLFCLLCLASTPFLDYDFHVPGVPTGIGVTLLSLAMAIGVYYRNGARFGRGAPVWGLVFLASAILTALGILALRRTHGRSPGPIHPLNDSSLVPPASGAPLPSAPPSRGAAR